MARAARWPRTFLRTGIGSEPFFVLLLFLCQLGSTGPGRGGGKGYPTLTAPQASKRSLKGGIEKHGRPGVAYGFPMYECSARRRVEFALLAVQGQNQPSSPQMVSPNRLLKWAFRLFWEGSRARAI